MKTRFVNPLPLVSDLGASVDFYEEVLGCKILERSDDFALFEGGFALHGASSMRDRLGLAPERDQPLGRDNLVLYFEADDLDAFWEALPSRAQILHGPREEPPAQRILRFGDPDGHIVEVGQEAPSSQ